MRVDIKHCLLSLIIIGFTTCSDNTLPDIYKTKSGLYASKEGKFVVDFPSKPIVFASPIQIGNLKYENYFFQFEMGPNEIYSVAYVDHPKEIIASWDTIEMFEQGAKQAASIGNMDVIEKTVLKEELFDFSMLHILAYKSNSQTRNYVIQKSIRVKNRLYYVSVLSAKGYPNNNDFKDFVKSFRLINLKK